MIISRSRIAIFVITGMILASTTVHAASFLRADGQFSVLFSRLEWKPGYGCTKPIRPYRMTSHDREMYLNDAQRYLRCIKRQADNDAKYAVDVIYEGYNEAADDFIREVETGY